MERFKFLMMLSFEIAVSASSMSQQPCATAPDSLVPCPWPAFVKPFYSPGSFAMAYTPSVVSSLDRNTSDFLGQHGVLGIDWEVDLQHVGLKYREVTLETQAKFFASFGQKDKLVFVYRQAKKALSIFALTNAVMRNASNADLFVLWANGTVFDEPLSVLPGASGIMHQYIYDYRSQNTKDLVVQLMTADLVIGSDNIAGVFIDGLETDDIWGAYPNISQKEVDAIIHGQHQVLVNVTDTLFDANYLAWQSFVERDLPDRAAGAAKCVATLTDLISFCNSTPAAVPGLYSNHCVGE
jgi:hypothetical protein